MTTMSFVAFSSRARNARSASRVGVGSALWIALKETSVLLRSGFSFLWITSSCIASPFHPAQDVHGPGLRCLIGSHDHDALGRKTVQHRRGRGRQGDADQGQKVLLASDFDAYPLLRLKGFGDHAPRVRRDRPRGVRDAHHDGSDPLQRVAELRILLAFRLEVDEAEVGRTAARDEVQRAEVPDGDHRARPSARARSSSIQSSLPSAGCRIVSPIFDSRGARSFRETATMRVRTLSPIRRSRFVSLPMSRCPSSSTSTRSSMTCEICRRPSRGPNLTKAPNLRISTTVPSTISWSVGAKTSASYRTRW